MFRFFLQITGETRPTKFSPRRDISDDGIAVFSCGDSASGEHKELIGTHRDQFTAGLGSSPQYGGFSIMLLAAVLPLALSGRNGAFIQVWE